MNLRIKSRSLTRQGNIPTGIQEIPIGHVGTSSTAQGGGGSFKDRKPIGEVDGCDAWMAETNPLMDRKVVGTSAYLSVYLSDSLTNYLTNYLTNSLAIIQSNLLID